MSLTRRNINMFQPVETKLSNQKPVILFCLTANSLCSENLCGENACSKDAYGENTGLESKLFFFFWPHHTACGILIPRPGIDPTPPAVEAPSLNHWTTRDVPKLLVCGNFSIRWSLNIYRINETAWLAIFFCSYWFVLFIVIDKTPFYYEVGSTFFMFAFYLAIADI